MHLLLIIIAIGIFSASGWAIEGVIFQPEFPPVQITAAEEKPIAPEELIAQFLPSYTLWLIQRTTTSRKSLFIALGDDLSLRALYIVPSYSLTAHATSRRDFSRRTNANINGSLTISGASSMLRAGLNATYIERASGAEKRTLLDTGANLSAFSLISRRVGLYSTLKLNYSSRKGASFYLPLYSGSASILLKWRTSRLTRIKTEVNLQRERLKETLSQSLLSWSNLRIRSAFCLSPGTHYIELGIGRDSNYYRALWYPYLRILFRTSPIAFEISSQGSFEDLHQTFSTLDPIYDFPLIPEAGRTITALKARLITGETALGKLELNLNYIPLDSAFTFSMTEDLPILSLGERKRFEISCSHNLTTSTLRNKLSLSYKKETDRYGYQLPYIPRFELTDSLSFSYRWFILSMVGNYVSRIYLPSYFLLHAGMGIKLGKILLTLMVENIQDKRFLWYPTRSDYGRKWLFQMACN